VCAYASHSAPSIPPLANALPGKVRSAYYFEKWPAVHKAFSDAAIKAVTGKREDIPKTLAEAAPLVSNAAK